MHQKVVSAFGKGCLSVDVEDSYSNEVLADLKVITYAIWLGLCVIRRTNSKDSETLFHVVILRKHHHHHHHHHHRPMCHLNQD
jgi:hypothetical protein